MQRKQGIYEKYVKRILDILFSMLFLILFWWLILVIALLVKIKLGSPVIFKQPRPGKNEKIFNMYKFRTMTDERDANGELLPDDRRLTKFGKFLRKTSCDELLEIFNILKGDMSFIGPRPLLVKYLNRYSEEQHHRHDVRPGLTGYAQVHGRNLLGWEERFALDLEYVKNITFWGDIKILIDTVKVVLKREGVSSSTSVTMEEFMGTEKNE
jgi:undecaprenyl phosphate N,N'-diacetylbacillosamine 1-phosphate transferase